MSGNIKPHRQCRSPTPVVVRARRRLARRCKNGQIDAADGLAVRRNIALESLGARPVLRMSLSQPHDTQPICTAATLKSP
jgi:hypothetical protein